ncbi:unannotated protein [freshwater metagenome]|uniref:Unannotated protein n=1 Tax=freshwater metagenome TaxID=449393 RepID=A0A6J7J222_9ZZZZ
MIDGHGRKRYVRLSTERPGHSTIQSTERSMAIDVDRMTLLATRNMSTAQIESSNAVSIRMVSRCGPKTNTAAP